MPKIQIQRQHALPFEEAKKNVQALVEHVQDRFPSLVSRIYWSPDGRVANVEGSAFRGTFALTDGEVTGVIDLSWFARPFLPRIQREIESTLEHYFGPN